MAEILLLCGRNPFAGQDALRCRWRRILQRLSRSANVHLAAIEDSPPGEEALALTDRATATHCTVTRRRPAYKSMLQAFVRRESLCVAYGYDQRLEAYVDDLVRKRSIDTIMVAGGEAAQYLPADFPGRLVADITGVRSAYFEEWAPALKGFRARLFRREARLLRAEEARLAERAHVGLLGSQQELDWFRQRLPREIRRTTALRVLGIGVEASWFNSGTSQPAPQLAATGAPRIVMPLNRRPSTLVAAHRVAEQVFPAIRAKFPEASLHLVASVPGRTLEMLARHPGVHVWRQGPDLRPWLAASDLVIFAPPSSHAIEPRLLRAMAMGAAIVANPAGMAGIGALPGRDLALGESDEELAQICVELAGQPETRAAMGASARAWAKEYANWNSVLVDIPEIAGTLSRHPGPVRG